jgi:hypothetical protein
LASRLLQRIGNKDRILHASQPASREAAASWKCLAPGGGHCANK